MKLLQTFKNCIIKVDDEDYKWLSQYKWYCSNGYAQRYNGKGERPYLIRMHREIMEYYGYDIRDLMVDHKNGNPLDNRKSNLRVATHSQNLINRGKPVHNTSGYKGVSFRKSENCYEAYITVRKKRIRLGLFDDIIKAAKAYDYAALKYHKEFAVLNFPDDIPEPIKPRNIVIEKHNSTGYRGVSQRGDSKKFRMDFQCKGIKKTKTFKTAMEAAKEYDKLAKKYLGDKARLNFPNG